MMSGYNDDIHQRQIDKLAQLFPEVVTEGKIDWQKLQATLGEAVDLGERYGLSWKGKSDVFATIQEKTVQTLHPDRANSVDWDTTGNMFIEGDNLATLKILHKAYYGKVKMIYIDPPYNTGKDFVYPDNYADPIGSYLEMTGQADESGKLSTNSESAGRFHSNWLNMMYPRLKLAKNLLSDSGAIAVSISDSESGNLKALLDQVFGESNMVAIFPRRGSGGKQDSQHVAIVHEYVIVYARNKCSLKTGLQAIDRAPSSMTDSDGRKYSLTLLRKWGDNSRREDRPNLYYPIFDPEGADHYPMLGDGREGRWRWSASRMQAEIDADNVEFKKDPAGSWVAYQKVYDDERASGKKFDTWLDDFSKSGSSEIKDLFGGVSLFDYPKPTSLIMHIAKVLGSRDSDLIVDFFAGSGTTAHAVMALNAEDGGNRRCISVQLPEPTDEKSEAHKAGFKTISEITRERIRRAGAEILAKESEKLDGRADDLDVGFRAYKLVDTNFAKWRAESGLSEGELVDLLSALEDSADDSAQPEALLTEILLKLGFSLSEKIEEVDVAGLSAYSVADGLLLAYLDEHTTPTLDQLRALVAEEPERLVVLEDVFKGNDELKTNLAQECRTRNVDLWTV